MSSSPGVLFFGTGRGWSTLGRKVPGTLICTESRTEAVVGTDRPESSATPPWRPSTSAPTTSSDGPVLTTTTCRPGRNVGGAEVSPVTLRRTERGLRPSSCPLPVSRSLVPEPRRSSGRLGHGVTSRVMVTKQRLSTAYLLPRSPCTETGPRDMCLLEPRAPAVQTLESRELTKYFIHST